MRPRAVQIVHAADDKLAHYETAPRAAVRIPGARFVTIDRGGHLFVGSEALVRNEVGGFIRSLTAAVVAEQDLDRVGVNAGV